MAQILKAGGRAPGFSLRAVGSGRKVSPEAVAGRTVVLVFHFQSTAATARRINYAVRARYPEPDRVLVASVVDMSFVPPFYQPMAGPFLYGAYEQTASRLPPEADPADYVVILPDWGGGVSRAYGARRTDRTAAVVVIDENSNIAGSYQGDGPIEAVMEILDGLQGVRGYSFIPRGETD